MSTTPILGINEVAENQVDKYITINDAIRALEAATNAGYTNTVASAAAVNLSAYQATRYVLYRMTAKTGNFDLVFPSSIGGSPASRKAFVWNDTAYTCTIKASTGTGTTVVLGVGERAEISQYYEDIIKLNAAPYDTGFFMPGVLSDGMTVMSFVVARAFTLANNLSGSVGYVGVNPSASATFDVKKNGVSIGSIVVSTLGVFTFTTVSGAVTFAVGDRLTVTGPSPADSTLADVSITLAGTRN